MTRADRPGDSVAGDGTATSSLPTSMLEPVAPAAPRPRVPWAWRLRDAALAYLPVLMMAGLALGTWWLVKSTPEPESPRAAAPPRHEPDYTMEQFLVRRYAADGRLRVELEGRELRHYPDTDTMEVDDVRLRAIDRQGRVTVATARRAVSNGDATEVQLMGDARVHREASVDEEALWFEGDFLHAFLDTERLRSHLPVVVTQGGSRMRADGFEYDNLSRTVVFHGRVHVTMAPRGAALPPASPAASTPAASAPADHGSEPTR